MRLIFFLLVLAICVSVKLVCCQHPEVNTTSGIVIGITNLDVHSFYGVRYGQAPVEELRYFLYETKSMFVNTEFLRAVQTLPDCFKLKIMF